MKTQVYDNLYIGSDEVCFTSEKQGWAVVHACKEPCHKEAVGYRNTLSKEHPHYLKYEEDSHLYLNLIDPEKPLFHISSFTDTLNFIKEKISDNKVLVHCNKGLSRSPSIVLLYLVTEKQIDNSSYSQARKEFQNDFYPKYNPSGGIQKFLTQNWQEIIMN